MGLIVTGAAGHLGRRTAELLLELRQPDRLILVTRDPDAIADLARHGADVRFGDFDRPESLAPAFAGGAVLLGSGHESRVYDVTGPESFTAADLAALYGRLGGRSIEAVPVDDESFVAGLVGNAGTDDHLKYGAELVASFGRAIREGF